MLPVKTLTLSTGGEKPATRISHSGLTDSLIRIQSDNQSESSQHQYINTPDNQSENSQHQYINTSDNQINKASDSATEFHKIN